MFFSHFRGLKELIDNDSTAQQVFVGLDLN